jgi:hypothetical protein
MLCILPERSMGKKRRERAEWLELVQSWKASGQAAHVFAAERGVSAASLYWWSRELKQSASETESMRLLPVEVRGHVDGPMLELEVNAVRVQVPVGADISYVTSLVAALRRGQAC